jgi:hypothetical protein
LARRDLETATGIALLDCVWPNIYPRLIDDSPGFRLGPVLIAQRPNRMEHDIGSGNSPGTLAATRRLRSTVGLAAALLASFLLLFYFHDRYWFPRDDGYYAHIADRILGGELLHRDVQALHPGGIYYLNALAMSIFGRSFTSLRFPLIAAGLLQTLLLFLIMRQKGVAIAAATGLLSSAVTIVQFFNPTPHWYCLPIGFAVILLLAPGHRHLRWRIETIGLLLVTMFWFRQLTAIFVAVGAVSYLLLQTRGQVPNRSVLGRGLILLMLVAVALYLRRKTDLFGWLAIGMWPILLLAVAALRTAVDDKQVLILVRRLTVGGAAVAVPILLYHAASGSLEAWFKDVFLDAVALGEFAYQKTPRYGSFLVRSLGNLFAFQDAAAVVNGIYWLVMLAAPATLAISVLVRMTPTGHLGGVAPLPFIGVFYGLVAVHYQDPAYLYFASAPVFAGLIWYAAGWRNTSIAAAAVLTTVAIYFHAGQPISRSYADLLSGKRQQAVASSIAALDGMHVTPSDELTFRSLLAIVDRHSAPGEPILAVPAEPELFFMSGRSNPLRYSYLSFGILDDEAVAETLRTLERTRPRIVFHVPVLPYNSEYTDMIMDWVRENYVHVQSVREFEVYLPAPAG